VSWLRIARARRREHSAICCSIVFSTTASRQEIRASERGFDLLEREESNPARASAVHVSEHD